MLPPLLPLSSTFCVRQFSWYSLAFVRCFTPFSFTIFPLLCPASFVPLLPSLCSGVVFFPIFVCLICWLFGTLCGCYPWGFTQTLSSSSKCAANLLRTRFAAHRPLPVFFCVPPRCAFNATSFVNFQLVRDWLPPDCRHPPNLLSLFFLWLFFFVFTCICLFFHCYFPICFLLFVPFIFIFIFFFNFVILFPCAFFLSCFCL